MIPRIVAVLSQGFFFLTHWFLNQVQALRFCAFKSLVCSVPILLLNACFDENRKSD